MDETRKEIIAVAGAAGFVGRPLVKILTRRFRVIALSRQARTEEESLQWRQADLLSHRDAATAVEGASYAIYLVHSMMPSDRLVQGRFEDLDLQAADNFARACATTRVRQIVYLGGLLPSDTPAEKLSRHLRSRAEVERALGAYGVPVTVLRAGLILGPSGSSMEILLRIARRLPLMLCPRWTNSPAQPIALSDVLTLLDWVVGRPDTYGEIFDVGGPDIVTYRELMQLTGEALGRRPRTFSVPVLTPRLSRLWVSLVTGAPKALVEPLIDSLSHEMLTRDRRLQEQAGVPGKSVRAALREVMEQAPRRNVPRAFQGSPETKRIVRSVQRLPSPQMDVKQIAAEYFHQLNRWGGFLLGVNGNGQDGWTIRLGTAGPILMRFVPDHGRSTSDRIVFDLVEGVLIDERETGRFEFRKVLGGTALLCSVHGFAPRLWWPLYVVTQAPLHLLVMKAFGYHLAHEPQTDPPEVAADP
jgi:uncharacterized protein YbjT (DUF2867 family)